MPVLLGVLVGRTFGLLLGRVVLSHAVLTVFLWYAVAAGAFWLAYRNLGPAAGPYACVLVPVALLGWTLWRPAENRIKLWMFDGLYVWTRLGIAYAILRLAVALLAAEGRIKPSLSQAWPWVLLAIACWLLQRGMVRWLRRSHRLAGTKGIAE